MDFLAAHRQGFAEGVNSRMGVGPIETLDAHGADMGSVHYLWFEQRTYLTRMHTINRQRVSENALSKIVIIEHVCHRIPILQLPNFNYPIILSFFISSRTLFDTRVSYILRPGSRHVRHPGVELLETRVSYKLPLLQKKNFITGKQMQLSSLPQIAYTT